MHAHCFEIQIAWNTEYVHNTIFLNPENGAPWDFSSNEISCCVYNRKAVCRKKILVCKKKRKMTTKKREIWLCKTMMKKKKRICPCKKKRICPCKKKRLRINWNFKVYQTWRSILDSHKPQDCQRNHHLKWNWWSLQFQSHNWAWKSQREQICGLWICRQIPVKTISQSI